MAFDHRSGGHRAAGRAVMIGHELMIIHRVFGGVAISSVPEAVVSELDIPAAIEQLTEFKQDIIGVISSNDFKVIGPVTTMEIGRRLLRLETVGIDTVGIGRAAAWRMRNQRVPTAFTE